MGQYWVYYRINKNGKNGVVDPLELSSFQRVSIYCSHGGSPIPGWFKKNGIWIQCLVGGLEHAFYFSIDWE